MEQCGHDKEGVHQHDPGNVEVHAVGRCSQRRVAHCPLSTVRMTRKAACAVELIEEVLLLNPAVIQPGGEGFCIANGNLGDRIPPIVEVHHTGLPEAPRDSQQVQGLPNIRVANGDVDYPFQRFLFAS